ncbi:MAG TPA: TAT-variant-translocated molybdopterin oxidoreductase [Polyangia bacterium]|nr:TAT-variant-translocated molybdopterin oxidoreductase [Polyangia bacterium]
MSCDEHNNHRRSAGKARRSRSLAIVSEGEAGQPGQPQSSAAAEPRYWRSLDERAQAPAWQQAAHREFPPGASELNDGVSRRSFMQLLGVSTAVASLGAACRKPNEKIVPFVRRPDEVTPGNPQHFATAHTLEGFATGLVVESHEGHPTKVEGNPDHPISLGAATSFDQALIQSLYDENRARQITRDGTALAWRTLLEDIARRAPILAADGGAKLRFLTEPTASPLLGDLRRRIIEKFPRARFVSYSSTGGEAPAEGARLCFGRPLQPRQDLMQAQVVLSLDADFLGDGPDLLLHARQFANRREPGPNMNRLYVVEPAMTITGGMADHRLRLRGAEVPAFTLGLIAALTDRPGFESLAPLAGLARAQGAGAWDAKWLGAMARDLEKNRGRCLVIAGRRQPAAVHALVHALNVALGNLGRTVSFGAPVLVDGASGVAGLGALAEDIAAGQVDTLVVTAVNPAYTAPADLKLGALLRRVPNTIYLTMYDDETAAGCHTVVPALHVLETWGDARATDGTATLVQPLIAPLWGGYTESELLAAFVGEGDLGAHQLVRRYWQGRLGASGPISARISEMGRPDFDSAWERWLADGIIPGTVVPAEEGLSVDGGALAGSVAPMMSRKADGLELAFVRDAKVFDGRFANNAWLQELPDPITKLTWDNALQISKTTAEKLGLETGDLVAVDFRQRKMEAAVMIVPGHADDAVTLPLGYGRSGGGEAVAHGVGFNANLIRPSDAMWFGRGVTLAKLDERYKFALTEDHWTMSPDGRDIPPPAVETPLAALLKEGSEFHQEIEERRGPAATIHTPVDYSNQRYRWAMAIDLNRCTGCNACVTACQSENNIPVVGKVNVAKGREMQWIRIDRYFSGSTEDPSMVMQPLACVHCESAPCEYVCPVNATVHSDEGINEMAYNRCIGTRYCSNNCPYKVRRFNFLDYNGFESDTGVTAARQMGMNPDVTVRSRGVMEKCTYCVQRIERKRIDARVAGVPIADGDILTACQQGCPSAAITFGSLGDPSARVSKLHASPRRYDLLHEIGTRPRTAYLARVKNPNPELARAE